MDLDIVHDYGTYREEQGIKQGKDLGRGEEKVKTAINMLNEGYSINQIEKVTHLDANSIEQLKNSK